MRRPAAALVWGVLAIGWTALVWALLTTATPPELPGGWVPAMVQPWSDKLAHAALFFVETAVLERLLAARGGGALARRRSRFAVALAASLVLGAASELRQRSIATREASVGDLAADAAGAVVYGALLAAPRSRSRSASASGS